ncbi:MAG: C-GCAxxG-C-C family protein [Actinobacteria bacterium]|nr:C-GCAxxG-C-C family protein [Actinomycetota bacterium]
MRSNGGCKATASAGEIAAGYFDRDYNCAQSVLLAISEKRRIRLPMEMVDACAALTGGLGKSGCTCGALVGASLAIGLVEKERRILYRKRRIVDATAGFHDLFQRRFRSTCCRVIRGGLDYDDPGLKDHCGRVTSSTAQMLDDYLFGGQI